MASHGLPPGLLPFHEQHAVSRARLDLQPIFSNPGLKQDIVRQANADLTRYQLDEQWKPISGFSESSQIMKFDHVFTTPVLLDGKDNLPGSFPFTFGIAERCEEHEKVIKFLASGANQAEKELDLTLMSGLMEFQVTITDMLQHHAAKHGPRSHTRVEIEPSFLYLSKTIYAQANILKFAEDFLPRSAVSIGPDGETSFVGSMTEMKDLLSILAEFYLPKFSAKWNGQTALVPQFEWGSTVEPPAFINEASSMLEELKFAPLKSPLKNKPKSAPGRKASKKAVKSKDLHQKNYSQACECLLSLIMNKNRNRTLVNALKRSGPELPEMLTQLSATTAGTGLAVLLSVLCKVACGSAHFSASKLTTTSTGVGFFWLSWAVNKLRDTISFVKKNQARLGSKEEKDMVKRLDTSVNDILFRAATLAAAVVLLLA